VCRTDRPCRPNTQNRDGPMTEQNPKTASVILGISGLENSVPFKQKLWPGLLPAEYRISQGHDAAAAILVNGELVAAAEQERFSLKKHTGAFPAGAIQFCLKQAGVSLDQVTEIAHGFDY